MTKFLFKPTPFSFGYDEALYAFLDDGSLARVLPASSAADTGADGLRDGLLVFFVGVVLFCVAAAVDSLTDLLVAAAPVVMLASFVAVSRVASNTSRRGVGQWGGAGGAVCEDHFAFCGEL